MREGGKSVWCREKELGAETVIGMDLWAVSGSRHEKFFTVLPCWRIAVFVLWWSYVVRKREVVLRLF